MEIAEQIINGMLRLVTILYVLFIVIGIPLWLIILSFMISDSLRDRREIWSKHYDISYKVEDLLREKDAKSS